MRITVVHSTVDIPARKTGPTVLAVGAAFDFAAGALSEAPRASRSSGFGWHYRLFQEPRRWWSRYLLGNIAFVPTLMAHQQEPPRDRRKDG
jgi:N-acetylglucosaminyldiphosphoundecaprenol N-acetyl-beta-D-mannosaminyltransferase